MGVICKNICNTKYQIGFKFGKRRYKGDIIKFPRCKTCEFYFNDTTLIWCPCCGQRVKYKLKFRSKA